ncbi:periplasmic thiol:disulfide interchange protein DsbA [Sulfuriferula multivorans]|uniref:Thiol:disulfide interchange protein n=1 Tax=Sulfuriferula multivorans TaxID=1559896 RepID=A0A401JGD8_9PROT|nr:thiol:disulfide interchange protein DsbA/DsbL [Sulfuriferula multivorans]GBL46653.1 periplasmic thiol:disulfide interchange protein DsbA [Sulfuriferula multivorans]
MSLMRKFLLMITLLGMGAFPLAHADSAHPVEGKDYQVVSPELNTDSGKKIEVAEFFWYRCPHCFHLEPALNAWIKKLPKDVAIRRIPAVLNESWLPLAKTYYTLELLGKIPALHDDVFNAIHVEGIDLNNPDILFNWAAKQGINRKTFVDTYNSFDVQSKAMRANQLTRDSKINGVPAFIVAGKYSTSVSMTGSEDALFKTLDSLIAKARKEQSKQARHAPAKKH